MKKSFGFGDLFGRSWDIFRSKFGLLVGLAFVFSFLPNLIYGFWMSGREDVWAGDVVPSVAEVWSEVAVGVPAVVVLSVLSIFMTVCVVYLLNVKSKRVMSFGEAVKGGSNYLWSGILLSLLLFVFLVPLFILLIVPGIIFGVYWVFAYNALIIDKTSVRKALTKSHEVAKGKWWRVFGYFILYGLIVIVVSILPELVFVALGNVGAVLNIALSSLVSVFSLVFVNEFYLSLKGKK